MQTAIDDLGCLDRDPAEAPDVDAERRAHRALTMLADRQPDHFTGEIIRMMFDLVNEPGIVSVLDVLRRLSIPRHELARTLLDVALGVLRQRPSVEAARCVNDHAALLHPADIDDDVARQLIVLAGSKTQGEHSFSGPAPVVDVNEPAALRIATDLAPERVASVLATMLPVPEPEGLVLPPGRRPVRVDDFQRRAAAGAIMSLTATHLDFAMSTADALIRSLGVPPEDSYDPGTVGEAHRALGAMLAQRPEPVTAIMESRGQHASEPIRTGIVSAVWQATNMLDPDDPHRRPGDPRLDADQVRAAVPSIVAFLLRRLDGSWGDENLVETADVLQSVVRDRAADLVDQLPAFLGSFLGIVDRRLNPRSPSILDPHQDTDGPLAALERTTSGFALDGTASRLLQVVENIADVRPRETCMAITDLIANERQIDRGPTVITHLIKVLGTIGADHGQDAGVIQAILPTLHTYMVDIDVVLVSRAIRAWTQIGSRHSLPPALSDLLPVLVLDPHVVVIDALLEAAARLSWADQNTRLLLAAHARRVVDNIDISEHFDTFLKGLAAFRATMQDTEAVALLELRVLERLPPLARHQARALIDQPWQPSSRTSPVLATLLLQMAPYYTSGIRDRNAVEKVHRQLLDCGAGLAGVDTDLFVSIGAGHAPENLYAVLEYAELLTLVERRQDAASLIENAIERTPDQPARQPHRILLRLAHAYARLQAALQLPQESADVSGDPQPATSNPPTGGRDPRTAPDGQGTQLTAMQAAAGPIVADISARLDACDQYARYGRDWLLQHMRAIAIRTEIVCLLLGIAVPPEVAQRSQPDDAVTSEATGHDQADADRDDVPGAQHDPASELAQRAQRLRLLGTWLLNDRTSATTIGDVAVQAASSAITVAAYLLDADAAAFSADVPASQASRLAAAKRNHALATTVRESKFEDEPLLAPVRAFQILTAATVSQPLLDPDSALIAAAALPIPLLFVTQTKATYPSRPWSPEEPPSPYSETVAVALASIDDKLITGPAIIDPNLTHELTLQVQTDPWPDWVDRLDAEFVSVLDTTQLERPAFTWRRKDHDADPDTFSKTGSLLVRYRVPTGQAAPAVHISLTWRGVDADGQPRSQSLSVAGHRDIRIRPFDYALDATTQYEVFDEHLLRIYEQLSSSGYPHAHLQAFARLLNAISRAGLAMTWNEKYRKGANVRESKFHDDLHQTLMADPTLGGRVERGTPSALGFLDVRHDGVTAELKVERTVPVTAATAPKYIGQPTQYAAVDGVRVSILVILDMSPKILPIGTPENYLFMLQPQQHGLADPEAPSIVVTLVVNGSLPTPSSWSRRRVPTR